MMKCKKVKNLVEVGDLLIAKPFINQYIYQRSVVLIIYRDLFETLGVILNKASNMCVCEALEHIDHHDSLYIGGLCESNVVNYIHRRNDINDSDKILDNLYFNGDFKQLAKLVNKDGINHNDIKFIIGISKWKNEELENQLNTDLWWITKTSAEEVLTIDNADLWSNKLLANGHVYGLFDQVYDPSYN